jgi:preprotein translocase subunit SecF
MVTVLVMYIAGGPGIHGFTFVLLAGILVGTYSSIAIAAPLLLLGGHKEEERAGLPAAKQAQRA